MKDTLIEDGIDTGKNVLEIALQISYIEAVNETYMYLDEIIEYMMQSDFANTNDGKALKSALNFYFEILHSDSKINFLFKEIGNSRKETALDLSLYSFFKYIGENNIFGKETKLIKDLFENFKEWSNLNERQECLANLILLNNLHKSVTNAVYNTGENFINTLNYEDAIKFHTALNLYFSIDKTAVKVAQKYMSHIPTNEIMLRKAPFITTLFEEETLDEIIELLNIQERLDEYINDCDIGSCCKYKAPESKKISSEKELTGILVACPVDVEIYYKDELINTVSNESEMYHNSDLNITTLSIPEKESDSRGKLVFYPNTDDYSYKIIGKNDGEMSIICFSLNLDSHSNLNISELMNYNFSNIKVKKNEEYVVNLKNGEYTVDSNKSNIFDSIFLQHKKKMLFFIGLILIICCVTIIYKYKKRT